MPIFTLTCFPSLYLLLFLFLISPSSLAALNGPCIGTNNKPGVCISTTDCSAAKGTTIANRCPSDPSHVGCCTKPTCAGGTATSNCRWTSDCSGTAVSNQCPGPAAFKCCKSEARGFGGYAEPPRGMPGSAGACKAVAVAGAKKVVAKFPKRVREIGCVRDCACGSGSDHCCGKAIDFMCSDAGGVATTSGQEIAEWAMNNCAGLRCKYVIWGQRIWNSGDARKGWLSWEAMEDRKSITDNHWDHVHVSFE